MIIDKLSMRGFKGFVQKTTLRMGKSGLVRMSGRNEVDPQMEGNAVGKSTVWDAICWCFFGKTARGLRAGNVVTWGSCRKPGCWVRVRVRTDTGVMVIERTQSPNKLRAKVNGKWRDTDQTVVDGVVGMNYSTFLHCVLMGQFGTFFFDMSAADKLSLFSSIMNLDIYGRASDEAKAAGDKLNVRKDELVSNVATLTGRIKQLKSQHVKLKRDHDEWASKADVPMTAAKKKLRVLRTNESTESARANKLDAAYQKRVGQLRELRQLMDAANHRIAGAGTECLRLDTELRVVNTKIEVYQMTKQCPECGQDVSSKLQGDRLRDLERRRDKICERLREEAASRDKTQATLRKWEAEEAELKTTADAVYVNLERANSRVHDLSERIRDLQRDVDAANKAKSMNPYKKQLVDTKLMLGIMRGKRDAARAELAELEDHYHRAMYWHKAFRDLRLWVIDNTLRELELEVNSCIEALGLHGWSVRFDVERETKSGTVARGFSVFIRSPGTSSDVPWESWSGGETQRLRVAGSAGLANMIRAKRGVRCNLEVWDEPTHHVNPQGIEDMMAWFAERSRVERRQIWIADHRSLDSGAFDAEYCVVKNKRGSSIFQADV